MAFCVNVQLGCVLNTKVRIAYLANILQIHLIYASSRHRAIFILILVS